MTNERPATAGRSSLVGLRALLFVLVALAAVLSASACGGDESAKAPEAAHPERCADLEGDAARECYIQEFLLLVEGADDSRDAVADIASTAREKGGYLLSNCHGIMHTVGRTYAGEEGVTLATLMDYLPPSNDPGCTAGYSHGLATAVAPELHSAEPQEVADVCAEAETRYQRYSCTHGFGHAYMRMHGDRLEPALEFCRSLGTENAPDCAQGAYHDYWFATLGLDDAKVPGRVETDPFVLCAEQPDEFVRACWYRAFLETRPDGFQLETAADVAGLCEGLSGLQRGGCITAASVIGPTDPAAQLEVCAGLPDAEDAKNCVRGTKVQNLLDATIADYIALIEGCERFDKRSRAECYRWLGKILAVVTDGAFADEGCPELQSDAARRECAVGADSMDDALVTFS